MRPSVSYAILCDGSFPENPLVLERLLACDVVVCCDGAAKSFMKYRKPEFVVGDMDSLAPELKEVLSDQIYSVDEQETNDLSKAFRWVCSLLHVGGGHRLPKFSITIFGATGMREDHTLGNISLLADYAKHLKDMGADGEVSIMTDYGTFFPVLDTTDFHFEKGQAVSIFAFDHTLRMESEGLEYPVCDVHFDMWWKASLNKAIGGSAQLRFSHPAKSLIYLSAYFGKSPKRQSR